MRKFCIVRKHLGRWHAWDSEARLIAWRPSWPELVDLLAERGYERVSSSSRLGATILDKLGLEEALVDQLLRKDP
jgi:hypothetical protein